MDGMGWAGLGWAGIGSNRMDAWIFEGCPQDHRHTHATKAAASRTVQLRLRSTGLLGRSKGPGCPHLEFQLERLPRSD